MATGRTPAKFVRCYLNGYDMSGYTRSIGPLAETYGEQDETTYADAVKGGVLGQATLSIGTLSSVFDNTATSGSHAQFSALAGAGVMRDVQVAIGIRAEPAQGDPVYGYEFEQTSYVLSPSDNSLAVDIGFAPSGRSATLLYDHPWGRLLHAKGAETAVNAATGIDDLAATAFGGYMMYNVTAGDGTATIKVQDASTNSDGSFSDLVTSGSIDCSTVKYGLVALGRTAAVARYLRWQITLGTASTVTFITSFHRALR